MNTATLADFLGRAGLDVESAERAIVARQRFGGFWSIDEFITAAQPPPDHDARVRNLVTVSTLPQKPQPGRPDSPNRQDGDDRPDLDVSSPTNRSCLFGEARGGLMSGRHSIEGRRPLRNLLDTVEPWLSHPGHAART